SRRFGAPHAAARRRHRPQGAARLPARAAPPRPCPRAARHDHRRAAARPRRAPARGGLASAPDLAAERAAAIAQRLGDMEAPHVFAWSRRLAALTIELK